MEDFNQDSLSSMVSLIGTSADPTANIQFGESCHTIDIEKWYAGGGLATVLCNFWGNRVVNGIHVVSVENEHDSARSNKQHEMLAQWVNDEFKRLNVESLLINAYRQAQIAPASPIVAITSDNLPLSTSIRKSRYKQVDVFEILDPKHVQPANIWIANKPINHNFVDYYEIIINGMAINAERLVPFCLNPLMPCEEPADMYEKNWGRPNISRNVIDASINYQTAVKAVEILLQKKNFLCVLINGFLKGMSGNDSEKYAQKIVGIVRAVQQTSNILNVGVIDGEEMDIKSVERHLNGVKESIDKIFQYLLACVDDIPESYLVGTPNTGLSNSSNELERIDTIAQTKFDAIYPYITKILKIILASKNNPLQTYNISRLQVQRNKIFNVSERDLAEIRLLNARAESLEATTKAKSLVVKVSNDLQK